MGATELVGNALTMYNIGTIWTSAVTAINDGVTEWLGGYLPVVAVVFGSMIVIKIGTRVVKTYAK